MENYKYCNNCNNIKSIEKFYKKASYCKTCSNDKVLKYFKNKQDTVLECECGKMIKYFCLKAHQKTKTHYKNLKIKEFVTNLSELNLNTKTTDE